MTSLQSQAAHYKAKHPFSKPPGFCSIPDHLEVDVGDSDQEDESADEVVEMVTVTDAELPKLTDPVRTILLCIFCSP